MKVSPKAVANLVAGKSRLELPQLDILINKYCEKYFVSFDFTSFRELHVTDKVCVITIVLYFSFRFSLNLPVYTMSVISHFYILA